MAHARYCLLFMLLILLPLSVQAEAYLVYPEPAPNVVYIDGNTHKHYRAHQYERNDGFKAYAPVRGKYIDKNFTPDMATGDDDASEYPDMQIN